MVSNTTAATTIIHNPAYDFLEGIPLFLSQDLVDLVFNGILETVDTAESHEIGHTDEDKAKAEQPGERDARSVQMIQSEASQDGAINAEEHKGPPIRESKFLVIKALDKEHDTFEHHTHSKNDRQRDGQPNGIAKEDDTHEDLQQRREHACATVRHETLRAQSKHKA